MELGRYDLDTGQRHYFGNWKGWVESLTCYGPKSHERQQVQFQGPKQARLSTKDHLEEIDVQR